MRKLPSRIVAALVAALPALAVGQGVPLSDSLAISAPAAFTWNQDQTQIALFDGPVQIELDGVVMQARSAVVWISPVPSTANRRIEIALLGQAELKHGQARRSGNRLFVTATVRNQIRIRSESRRAAEQTSSPIFQMASELRIASGAVPTETTGQWRQPRPSALVEPTHVVPAGEGPSQSATTHARLLIQNFYTQRMSDGAIALIVDKGLTITLNRGRKQTTLLADRGILFTTLKDVQPDELQAITQAQDALESVYLEGDVRIVNADATPDHPDTTLQADRVFYEIATDRAVLTDAVLHTTDPSSRIPLILRAKTIKQLANEQDVAEYRLRDVRLTTSTFATPTYALAADKAYVRQVDVPGDWYGTRTTFAGTGTSLNLWGMPIFYLPYMAATAPERGFPLRSVDVGANDKFGFFTRSEWGLFESVGRHPPRNLDASFHADYLSDRGPAGGLDAKYRGHSITDATGEPSSFLGQFKSYFVQDEGEDDLGGDRLDVTPPEEFRGRIRWEHQQFLPDDWQVQLRYGWISDPTFLEQFFPGEFQGIEPTNTSAYFKRQHDDEALTLLIQAQPQDFVTTQEAMQEQFEIQKLPELGYYRLGESFGSQRLTFFSANTVSYLAFDDPAMNDPARMAKLGLTSLPGYPSAGYTGTPESEVLRGDLRQEIAAPLTIDRYRVLPYLLGRYTGYGDSPDDTQEHRGLIGAGVRVSTAFWKVDQAVESNLWDLHRLRHVIEPELHIFGAVSGSDRDDVFIFDEPIDAISDIGAVQVALHQRWQTQRGIPGRRKSVDFLTWNIEGNFFWNEPDDEPYLTGLPPGVPDPRRFRGLFFPSAPETSLARDSINSDALWRISDSTAALADVQYNLDEGELATASLGIAVRRGDRISYYIGDRYIPELDSNIASFLMNYRLSTRYDLGFRQSYDFGGDENVTSNVIIQRHFDGFTLLLTMTTDDRTGESGVYVSLRPSYLPSGVLPSEMTSLFAPQ